MTWPNPVRAVPTFAARGAVLPATAAPTEPIDRATTAAITNPRTFIFLPFPMFALSSTPERPDRFSRSTTRPKPAGRRLVSATRMEAVLVFSGDDCETGDGPASRDGVTPPRRCVRQPVPGG